MSRGLHYGTLDGVPLVPNTVAQRQSEQMRAWAGDFPHPGAAWSAARIKADMAATFDKLKVARLRLQTHLDELAAAEAAAAATVRRAEEEREQRVQQEELTSKLMREWTGEERDGDLDADSTSPDNVLIPIDDSRSSTTTTPATIASPPITARGSARDDTTLSAPLVDMSDGDDAASKSSSPHSGVAVAAVPRPPAFIAVPFALSEFEPDEDPFDAAERQVIDEKAELESLLSAAAAKLVAENDVAEKGEEEEGQGGKEDGESAEDTAAELSTSSTSSSSGEASETQASETVEEGEAEEEGGEVETEEMLVCVDTSNDDVTATTSSGGVQVDGDGKIDEGFVKSNVECATNASPLVADTPLISIEPTVDTVATPIHDSSGGGAAVIHDSSGGAAAVELRSPPSSPPAYAADNDHLAPTGTARSPSPSSRHSSVSYPSIFDSPLSSKPPKAAPPTTTRPPAATTAVETDVLSSESTREHNPTVEGFVSMGFPRASVKAALSAVQSGNDQEVLDYIIVFNECTEEHHFDATAVSAAIALCGTDLTLLRAHLTAYTRLVEFGFSPERVHRAVCDAKSDSDAALEQLLQQQDE